MTLDELLKDARGKLDAAPKAPWTYRPNFARNDGWFAYDSDGACITFAEVKEPTAQLIAAAPELLDKLIRICEVQARALEQITVGNWTYPVDAAMKEIAEIAGEG